MKAPEMKWIRFTIATFFAVPLLARPAQATGYVITIGVHASQSSIPWDNSFPSLRFQCLWLQPEISHAGYINVVEFEKTQALGGSFYNVRVWLCHTTKTQLESWFDNNYTGFTPVQVLNVPSLTFPPTTGYFDIGITPNTFLYNNTNNLLMEVRFNGHTGNQASCWRSAQPYARVYSDDENAYSGVVLNEGECIRLHIGTMAGVEPASFGKIKALFH